MFSNKNVGESSDLFCCEKCQYYTVKKFNYDKHLFTSKHLKSIFINENVAKSSKSSKSSSNNICNNCKKIYKDPSGLWRHKKTCSININNSPIIEEKIIEEKNIDVEKKDELINFLLKENQEFKGLILEVCKNFQNSNNFYNNTNTINSHNKTFNLQVFLNETCKDAMNFSDFIDSFDLKLSDLESMGKLGFVDGISNIIIDKLKKLDVEKRPIHCSDSKRETMYIKDDDKWEKEDDKMKHLKRIITDIQTKNIKLIPKWKELYPDCILSNSKHTDKFNDICIEIMGGKGSDILQKEEKIIRKIAKAVVINKND
jgi:hypothetical protein